MTDDMQRAREKFEAWLSPCWSREGDTNEDGDFVYRDEWVQGAWVGYRAALLAAPEGFVLVPVEPTLDMIGAALEELYINPDEPDDEARRVWSAMIAAPGATSE